MGSIPKGVRTANQVTDVGIYVKKEDRASLSTSDKLNLSRVAREGGTHNFTFFETDCKMEGDFQTM